ncbi:FprA family A-type flavoprotein [Candidatus Bathyarchaeota archaeon]|nr:FprA family A-type flavoprotein [Candidatus Bathyarchaeota archaeon]
MAWRYVLEFGRKVYWVGVKDRNRRIFDALIPLPRGTSYNAYLIVGSQKNALIDTVNPGFEKVLEDKIGKVMNPRDLDYVIMNHAEPDHAGSIPYILKLSDKAKLVVSKRGARMAQVFYGIPIERMLIVSDQDVIDLGDRRLQFIEAPMLHWPETMFSYLPEDGILFPCDFFGSHIAEPIYDDEVEDLVYQAKRYFGEIMMPFRPMAKRAMEKLRSLNIRIIAPSHGPIIRKPQRILEAYEKWTSGETLRKATLAYVTMWGSTEAMVTTLTETLASEGLQVALHNLATADLGDLAGDLVDSRAIILAAPTVLGGTHPLAAYAATLIKALKPPSKFLALLGSYGWGAASGRQMEEILGTLNLEVLGFVEVNGPPTDADLKRIVDLGKKISERMKEADAK